LIIALLDDITCQLIREKIERILRENKEEVEVRKALKPIFVVEAASRFADVDIVQ